MSLENDAQKEAQERAEEPFRGSGDEAAQNLNSLNQSDLGNSQTGISRSGKGPGFKNPIQGIRDKLEDAQSKAGKIRNAAGNIKQGAQLVQKAAGSLAKGTGKLAETAGKVEKAAGKLAKAAGQVEQAAGKVEQGIGRATNLMTDASALAEEALGLVPEIASAGIAVPFVQAAAGLTELLGHGAGATAEGAGMATDAVGKATQATGQAGEAIGDTTQAAGKAAQAAGGITGGNKFAAAGKSIGDKLAANRFLKKNTPFGTRWASKLAKKQTEDDMGGQMPSWVLWLMNIISSLWFCIGPLLLVFFAVVYFTTMLNGLMDTNNNSNNDSSGGAIGLETPPNVDRSDVVLGVYYKLPESADGYYTIRSCDEKRYGKIELLQFIHTAAKNWKINNPDKCTVAVGNLNTGYPPSVSHRWGIAVDITCSGLMMSDYNYDQAASIALIKEFFKTGLVKNLWYDDKDVVAIITSWIQENDLPGKIKEIGGHANHYHFDINVEQGPTTCPQCDDLNKSC